VLCKFVHGILHECNPDKEQWCAVVNLIKLVFLLWFICCLMSGQS